MSIKGYYPKQTTSPRDGYLYYVPGLANKPNGGYFIKEPEILLQRPSFLCEGRIPMISSISSTSEVLPAIPYSWAQRVAMSLNGTSGGPTTNHAIFQGSKLKYSRDVEHFLKSTAKTYTNCTSPTTPPSTPKTTKSPLQ